MSEETNTRSTESEVHFTEYERIDFVLHLVHLERAQDGNWDTTRPAKFAWRFFVLTHDTPNSSIHPVYYLHPKN